MYSGRSSRDSVGVMSRRDVITEDSVNTLRGDADVDRDKLETKTRNILEEYLNNVDPVEAFTCIQVKYFVQKWYNSQVNGINSLSPFFSFLTADEPFYKYLNH